MFLFRKEKNPIIVTIHGFGKKCRHEFDPLASYFTAKKYTVIQFDMYDIHNENDANYKQWIKRCEEQLKDVLKTKREVILIGFSMGGVIASYLASLYPVSKLILVAPAFQYLDLQKIGQQGIKSIKSIGKKEKQVPSSKQTKAFTDIVSQYKESISLVHCPVLFLHGTADEVIPPDSSRHAYKKTPSLKRLIFIEGGKHRMLYDGTMEQTCFVIIEQMILGNLF